MQQCIVYHKLHSKYTFFFFYLPHVIMRRSAEDFMRNNQTEVCLAQNQVTLSIKNTKHFKNCFYSVDQMSRIIENWC